MKHTNKIIPKVNPMILVLDKDMVDPPVMNELYLQYVFIPFVNEKIPS